MAWKIYGAFLILNFLYVKVEPKILTLENAKKIGLLVYKSYLLSEKISDDIPEQVDALATELHSVTNEMQKLEIFVREKLNGVVISIPEDVENNAEIDNDLRDIFNRIVMINGVFKSFYIEYLDKTISNSSLNVFISKGVSIDDDSPNMNSYKIYKLIIPKDLGDMKEGFFPRIARQLNTNIYQRCKKHQSPQQFLYEFHSLVTTVEARAFMMISTALMLKSFITHENYTREIQSAMNQHEERMQNYLIDLHKVMGSASTMMSRCSPVIDETNHLVGTSFYDLNIRPKMSDYRNNMVVTGVRLVFVKGFIHIQIEEGKLIEYGVISPGTDKWVDIDDMDSATRTINVNGVITPITVGVDYQFISWYDHVKIMMTTVPENCVIVGVNFDTYRIRRAHENYVYVIYLRLHYAKVDFDTGKIIPSTLDKTHDLVWGWAPWEISVMEHTVLNFVGGSTGNKDFMNLPEAYLDWQTMSTEPKIPLSGIGFQRTDNPKYGRSLSLHVSTFNIFPRIDVSEGKAIENSG